MPTSKSVGTNDATKKTKNKPTGKTGKMNHSEFHDFFIDALKDIHWAEKQLTTALPKMKKASTSEELSQAFEKHAQETQTHIQTLEKVFELLDEKPATKKCKAMEGLIEEATDVIENTKAGTLVRDAGLILCAQKVEHYEIATYGTLRTFAENMGHTDIMKLLQHTLDNEKETNNGLTAIAESFVNEQASEE